MAHSIQTINKRSTFVLISNKGKFIRGNTLFRNTAKGFIDTSESAGVTMGRWAWGSRFVDLNNDGWQDLVVANGYLSAADNGTGDL